MHQKQRVTNVPQSQCENVKMSSVVVWTVQSPCQAVTECWVDCSRLVVQRQRNFCHLIWVLVLGMVQTLVAAAAVQNSKSGKTETMDHRHILSSQWWLAEIVQ